MKETVSMPTAKEEIRRFLDTLPDDASWDDVQYSICVRDRVERGRREADEGKLIPHEEVEVEMKQWLDE
jgi:predicted transcriptional regulator